MKFNLIATALALVNITSANSVSNIIEQQDTKIADDPALFEHLIDIRDAGAEPIAVATAGTSMRRKSKNSKNSKSKKQAPSSTLRAVMNRYPGYTGDITPSGSVEVTFPKQNSTNLSYDLSGLRAECTDCGVHIHEGTTCDDADEVGGHYFSVAEDPWTPDGGATYDANKKGFAKGSFTLTSGEDTYADNVDHAVVIHDQNGTRISCGILKAFDPSSKSHKSKQSKRSKSKKYPPSFILPADMNPNLVK
mmetsp:Transcript_611/g.1347  ORF Transcript_611/g.1347 Transcript_611/m.1347 type:complete len:249 (+) Transcript_611:142-888(+)